LSDVKPGDLPERCLQLLNAREKAFRPHREFFLEKSRRQPAAFARRKGDGILAFRLQIWSAATSAARHRFGLSDRISFPGESKAPAPRCPAGVLQTLAIALLIIFASSCSQQSNQKTVLTVDVHEVTDEAGRIVQLPAHINRIVSLAPNLTEIVYAVGAGDRLVGDTVYCDYPAEAKHVTKIGDTTHPSIERIIALKPQIVLVSTASQLENFTRQLDEQKIAVYVTNPRSLEQIFHSIETLGDLFDQHNQAMTLAGDLRRRAQTVENAVAHTNPVKVFYQVSGEPLYTIGRDAYLTDLVKRAGGISVTGDVPTAFPRFSDEAALASRPEAIILPTGGSMGTANSTVALALRNSPAVLNNRVFRINDDHLSRPGPRLVVGLEEIARALHPEAFK